MTAKAARGSGSTGTQGVGLVVHEMPDSLQTKVDRREDEDSAACSACSCRSEGSILKSAILISRNRFRLEDMTTPGLKWTAGGSGVLLVRWSAMRRTASWPWRWGCW